MRFTIFLLLTLLTTTGMALTAEAEKGQAVLSACMSCHNPELNPPLAPPFYGIQNKYRQAHENKQAFIDAIVDWTKQPTTEKALMQRPLRLLGLMPAMPLPDDMLKSIATYVYEQEFEPPCTHWANDLARSDSGSTSGPGNGMGPGKAKGMGKGKGKGKGGSGNHDAMLRIKYDQLCK